jgi:hypothetical protein
MSRLLPLRSLLVAALLALMVLPSSLAFATGVASAQPVPRLQLSRATVGAGDVVVVTGTNFTPNDLATTTLPLSVTGGQRTIGASAPINAAGMFTADVTVPIDAMPGQYTLRTQDSHGKAATRAVTVLPRAELVVGGKAQTITVGSGHNFYIVGSGFAPQETVHITATFALNNGNTVTVSKTTTADASGKIAEMLITVPGNVKMGTYKLTATGASSGHSATASIVVAYHPSISLNTSSVRPGGTVTVTGSGFAPYSRVTISLPLTRTNGTSLTLAKTVIASAAGNVSARFTLPVAIRTGSYRVSAHGATSGLTVARAYVVSLAPSITAHPASITPGGKISLTGTGFSANVSIAVQTTVNLYGGGSRTISTRVTTNAQGNFTTSLTVPTNAAAGKLTILAQGPNRKLSTTTSVARLATSLSVSPAAVMPGGTVRITGAHYPANDTVQIAVGVTTIGGQHSTLTLTAHANASGAFAAILHVPSTITGGAYTVTAKSATSGRSPSARLTVTTLKTSIVASPAAAAPGTQVTVNGFGFAADEAVTLTWSGTTVGTVTTDAHGAFSTHITVPSSSASGKFTITAASAAGRKATASLTVNRQITTHEYFASFYTGSGYHEYLAILNPTATSGRVTITYQRKDGTTTTKTITVAAHTRTTEDVNADLGFHVSASAALAADVPIMAERYVLHNGSVTGGPGVSSPSTVWYFADGNSSGKYREYIAMQNPNSTPAQVSVSFLPTHHAAFTVTKTLAPTSRYTLKVNSYVRDAVGITVRSNLPVVANNTVYIKHGMSSKPGVTAPHTTWYFAAGPNIATAHNWIGVTNPTGTGSEVTLHAYNQAGKQVGSVRQWLKPDARVGYLMNKIAHQANVSVVLTSSAPIVAEQMTYQGGKHNASTDTFGTVSPAKNWAFANVDTSSGLAAQDTIDLFNPSLVPSSVVLEFITTSGSVISRTAVVGPMSRLTVNAASVVPNAQLGVTVTGSTPIVVMNRMSIDGNRGSVISQGISY